MFPQIQNEAEVELLETVVDHPSVSDGDQDGWYIDIHNEELNRTRDSDRFFEEESQGDYPVYGGETFGSSNMITPHVKPESSKALEC